MTRAENAISDACKRCVEGAFLGGDWRRLVDACEHWSCPLHSVRPRATSTRARAALGRVQTGSRE